MTHDTSRDRDGPQWFWVLTFGGIILYVLARMAGLWQPASGTVLASGSTLSNTFASVDHPFHVARAATLWRELAAGHVLRWMSQHQGGYPVEFYPLGEAWFEVGIRAMSFGALSPEGAHTLAVMAIFLLPAAAFVWLARQDGLSPAVAFLALALHVSLPGGWYDGGYTELVQWGLVTNVAAAVASLLMFTLTNRYLVNGDRRLAAWGAVLGSAAIYCNPRSALGLVALATGAWIAGFADVNGANARIGFLRVAHIAAGVGLLAAPELVALIRFGGLYTFVSYSGYDSLGTYLWTTIRSVGVPVLALAAAGGAIAIASRRYRGLLAVATSLVVYVAVTMLVAFFPAVGNLAPQLEPTRLMPLQRLLTLYLCAAAVAIGTDKLVGLWRAVPRWYTSLLTVLVAIAIVIVQTRPEYSESPDPAIPAIPNVSLYPVTTSGQPEQADLERAILAADEAASPGTALLVVGSALSWHQQLWAPLWTERSLYYDNWLWYWHPDHAGTPGYLPSAGNHYPDPEQTLDGAYLKAHGIGAVVVTGTTKRAADANPGLDRIQAGLYSAYRVVEPRTIVTISGTNVEDSSINPQQIIAWGNQPGMRALVRANWYPRWQIANDAGIVSRARDGSIAIDAVEPLREIQLRYAMQPLDWTARLMMFAGMTVVVLDVAGGQRGQRRRLRWYAR